MPKFNPSSDEVEKFLVHKGFVLTRQKGSHKQFVGTRNGIKRRVTVIANQSSFAPGTIASMIRQSGMSKKTWQEEISKL